MDSAKNTSLLEVEEEEDANISKFRKRTKILLIIFLSLIISLTLIIATLITHLMHDDDAISTQSDYPIFNPAIEAYYSSACYSPLCRTTLNPIIKTKSVTDPNQVFIISLQTASEQIQNATSLIFSNHNCSVSLGHAWSRINDILAKFQLNPFVEMQSDEQRSEMMKWITAVEENLESCMDDDMENTSPAAAAAVSEAQVYLSSSGAFVLSYAEVMQEFFSNSFRGVITRRRTRSELVFGVCFCGSQLLFIFCLFFTFFRTR